MPVFPRFVLLCCLAVSLHAAVLLDATYEQVIAAKGQPTGKMQAGDSLVLRYPDGVVRLRGGRVVAFEPAKGQPAPTPVPRPAPDATAPASKSGAAVAAKSKETGAAGKANWTTNYRVALTDAKEQKRRVFLFFTGSDWCGWCMRLHKEILDTPDFARYAADNLILVELDFPKRKPQPGDVKTQNESLARRFDIEGFPTVVVLDGNGKQVGRLGYQEGGPGPFVQRLKSL